jgi:hypothetical protein
MPLKMRRTGLGHGVYKDVPDYSVFSGEWCIGRIYQTRTGPPDLRWFWALNVVSKPLGLRTHGRLVMPAELQRVHRAVLDGVGITEDMRRIVEKRWPELVAKLPPLSSH